MIPVPPKTCIEIREIFLLFYISQSLQVCYEIIVLSATKKRELLPKKERLFVPAVFTLVSDTY